MTERRPFPPSPRRLALARRAGLTGASPIVVGAVACVAAIATAIVLARAAAGRLGEWIAAACRAADGGSAVVGGSDAIGASGPSGAVRASGALGANNVIDTDGSPLLDAAEIVPAVLELVAPLIVAAAVAALVAHVAQTRSLWLPRRRIAGAPSVEPAHVRQTAFDITAAAVVGVVAFAWLWLTAPRLALLFSVDAALPVVASAMASLVVALAIAWLGVAVIDALVRRVELARALAMTVTEKRDDDRIAAADPRWQKQRTMLARTPPASIAVARSFVVILGDDVAVAIAWHARLQPVPVRTITGRRAHATQLVGLARRHRVPVHRDAQLAATLVDGDGPVADGHWARLADIIAAVTGR
jgi:flagellar biosynthesis protein FlhB